MPVAETIPQTAEYEVWTGGNFPAVQALAGEDARIHGTGLQVRTGDGRWQDVFPGWTVHTAGGITGVMSAVAWRQFFRPVPQ